MKIGLYEALFVIGVGILSLLGAIQLWFEMKALGITSPFGPASFLAAISFLLIGGGGVLLIGGLRDRGISDPIASHPIVSERALILTSSLISYLPIVSIFGYLVGSLLFFPVLFYISGLRPWHRSVLSGLVMACLFYVVFDVLAGIPFPKGVFR